MQGKDHCIIPTKCIFSIALIPVVLQQHCVLLVQSCRHTTQTVKYFANTWKRLSRWFQLEYLLLFNSPKKSPFTAICTRNLRKEIIYIWGLGHAVSKVLAFALACVWFLEQVSSNMKCVWEQIQTQRPSNQINHISRFTSKKWSHFGISAFNHACSLVLWLRQGIYLNILTIYLSSRRVYPSFLAFHIITALRNTKGFRIPRSASTPALINPVVQFCVGVLCFFFAS